MSTWAEELAECIELIRDLAYVNQTDNTEKRKSVYDKDSAVRAFEVGDLVMIRTPGLLAKLEELWTGPWSIVEKCGPVSYWVKLVNGKSRGRVVQLNTVKEYYEREECG